MLHCSFSLAAAQLLVKMTSALQKSQCCSATSAAQHSENCSATSVFACGMLEGRGLEGWGLGLAELNAVWKQTWTVPVSVPVQARFLGHPFSLAREIRNLRVQHRENIHCFRWSVLESSRGPYYQQDLRMQGIVR